MKMFERGRAHLRVETRRDRATGEFVLILHQSDGTQLIDRFKTKEKLKKRLAAIERQLVANRWAAYQP
jgi:hypothetical protein